MLQRIDAALDSCDVFIVIGTSAVVYPAAGYIPYLRCQRPDASVIEINLETTSNSSICDVSFTGKAGELLPELFDVQEMMEQPSDLSL